MTNSSSIGQKLWNYSNVLRDAGLSYGDYLEQLTYLLFLKMMHERSQPPFTQLANYTPPPIPVRLSTGRALLERDGDELETHYRHIAGEACARESGTLRGHIQQGSEQDPGAGDADAAHQGLDRQRELAGA